MKGDSGVVVAGAGAFIGVFVVFAVVDVSAHAENRFSLCEVPQALWSP